MIILGIVLLLIAYLLPLVLAVPVGIITVCEVIGWILLAVGIVLWILGAFGRPVAGRRRWY